MTILFRQLKRKLSDKQIRSDSRNVAEQNSGGKYEVNIEMNKRCTFPSEIGRVEDRKTFVTKAIKDRQLKYFQHN